MRPKRAREDASWDLPWPWAVPLALAALTFVVFLPSLWNGFVDLDDLDNLIRNPSYRGLGLEQLRWAFTNYHMGLYLPLTWLSFGADFLLWGMEPRGYHLTNLLLHCANAALFYAVALDLLRRVWAAGVPLGTLRAGAAFAALAFAVHPLRVESVVWATERRDVLCLLFFLGTVRGYLSYADAQAGSRRAARLYWATAALYAASLLSKPMGVSLPFVLLILDAYPLRRAPRERLAEKAPLFLLALLVAINTVVGRRVEQNTVLPDYSLLQHLAFVCRNYAFYLWKTLLPYGLSPLYEAPVRLDPWSWPSLLSAFAVGGLSVAFARLRGSFPAGLANWSFYLVTLAPVAGFVRSGPVSAADRYSYFGCLGWALLAGGGLVRLLALPALKARRSAQSFALTACALLGVAYAPASWKQTLVWRNSASLWRQALAVDPKSHTAHNNLGNHHWAAKRLDQAVEHYRAALDLQPLYWPAWTNMGSVLLETGDTQKALFAFRRSLEINPRDSQTQSNLGAVFIRLGKLDEAVRSFETALSIDPNNQAAAANLNAVRDFLARQKRK